MRETAKELWNRSEEGQAFACMFVPEGGDALEETAEVVWVKGDVDTLEWGDVLWITPITYEGRRVHG